ncbi:MAG: type II secretion system protein GspJ [Candidatus Ratteibacteria bacterium]|jgi:prepilin-type N-terminal cleavage/methylation domain-containing protein
MKKRILLRQKGFSLIELLLAMTMVMILSGSLYASLRIGFRAHALAENELLSRSATGHALTLIDRDIQHAMPPRGVLAEPCSGDNTSLIICTRSASSKNIAPGIARVIYEFDENEHILLRRITANLLSPEEILPEGEIVCRNLASFLLRYYDGNDWLDEWDSMAHEDSLPVLIEVTLTAERTNENLRKEDLTVTRVIFPPCTTIPSSGNGISMRAL